jgi:MoaA/NifB/PqqE/SkfB family radical SAM enzyme
MEKIYLFFYLIFLELKRKIFDTKYFAEVDVTDNCNLRCKHCYHFNGKENFKTKELSLDIWKERFLELHKSGIRFMLLVGGEPALRNDVLMLANQIFPFNYVITNGTIKVPDFFKHPLFVSLDGTKETNDSIRGKGTFSKIMKNYLQDKRVAINMTIAKDNYKELEDVVKLAKENGFRGVVCNICAFGIDTTVPMAVKKNERKIIINELNRVKSKYPDHFLLTKSMIKWYEFANHIGFCYWGDEVLHFDVTWNQRRCFGSNADCSNCGCLAGAMQNPLKLLRNPKEMIKLFLY